MLNPDVVDPLNRPTGFKYITIVFPQGDDRDDQTLKSLFVSDFSDIVVSLLTDYKPDSRLRSSQNRSLLFLRQDITKTFNFFMQIEWSVFGKDYQRICVKNNHWTALYVNWIALII